MPQRARRRHRHPHPASAWLPRRPDLETPHYRPSLLSHPLPRKPPDSPSPRSSAPCRALLFVLAGSPALSVVTSPRLNCVAIPTSKAPAWPLPDSSSVTSASPSPFSRFPCSLQPS